MLEELAGYVLVRRIFLCQFQRNCQHVQAIHAHPARAVRLLEVASGGQGRRTVKDTDVIEPEKPALKDIRAVGIFAVHPPGEVQQQLMKHSFQESAIGDAAHAPLDFVDAPSGPRVHRWIHIAKGPFISGQLPVRVHVPFAQQQDKLFFCEIRVNQRQWNAVKRQVPCRVPWILPLVWHGDDVLIIKVRPFLVAAVPALRRWRGARGIALQPRLYVVMIKLLRPQHPRKRLPHDGLGIVGELFRDSCSVKLFGFFLARHEQAVESSAKIVGAGNAFGAFGFAG